MSDDLDLLSSLGTGLKVRVVWIGTALCDALFLVLWVVIQFIANRYIAKMDLSGPDKVMCGIFQWALIPIGLLAPILIWFYQDIGVMIIRARRRIHEERGKVT
jgi:hypothetical protein